MQPQSHHISNLAVVFLAVTLIATVIYPPRVGATGSLIPGIAGGIVIMVWAVLVICRAFLRKTSNPKSPNEKTSRGEAGDR
jgi:L-asparagine transporter-like permease